MDIIAISFLFKACGEHLRLSGSRELQISSPGYPRPYTPGISCTWVVDNPQQDNLTVTVVHMDIESSLSCSSDYLSISIGGSSRRCGKILRPISLTTVEKSVKMSFLSDYKNQGNGFLIEVKTAGKFMYLTNFGFVEYILMETTIFLKQVPINSFGLNLFIGCNR